MGKLFKNQKGFTVAEVLLTLIFLAIVGFVGYYVYHKNQNSEPVTSKSTTAIQTSSSPSDKTSSNDNTGYLVIKEWGIKVKLKDAGKLTYTMNGSPNGSPDADSVTSYATLKFNNKVDVPATCKDGKDLGVSISQLTTATNATKIGGYYYGFEGGVNKCGDDSTDALKQMIISQELVPGAITAE